MSLFAPAILTLILARVGTQLWLEYLNRSSVEAHHGRVPEAFKGTIAPETFLKSCEYTLSKTQFRQWEQVYDTLLLAMILFSGILPATFREFSRWAGTSNFAGAGFLFLIGIILGLLALPFDWYAQFRIEQRFGFNTMSGRLWWIDRLKGLCLSLVLGYPVLLLVLQIFQWTGPWWWLWSWAAIMAVQLILTVVAPFIILPWFNKLTPLPPGALQERLMRLADRTRFGAKTIQVMDGSKRSRHSNAFFAGFGRFRKIVLFDTLVEQLTPAELEAVLAHEIGHYKRGHIPKLLLGSAAAALAGFYLLGWLVEQTWFYAAFGLPPGYLVPALLLFALTGGLFSFWFSPLANYWSRRFEFQADAYASTAMGESSSLISALRKLNEQNLSNLIPHPAYSRFYYSHPTLLERERALTPEPAEAS